jgi:FtsH-binding integral membrane protein
MPSVRTQTAESAQRRSWNGNWYFPAMSLLMIAIAVAGFAPSLVDPSRRSAPITWLVAVHGILLFGWLLLFSLQTMLIATRHVSLHRSMGIVALALIVVLVPLSFEVTVEMVRRGFDLSGDQLAKGDDALFSAIFNFVAVIEFALLALAGLAFRRRKEVHKRLMLFANIPLMLAPITHFFGHLKVLSPLAILGSLVGLLVIAIAGDYFYGGRVPRLTWGLGIFVFVVQPVTAVFGKTPAWHHFAAWLVRIG